MEEPRRADALVGRVALLAPLVFAIHVLEEAPGFVAWFNGLVQPDITPAAFMTVNGAAAALATANPGDFRRFELAGLGLVS